MAAEAIFPQNDQVSDDRRGTYFRIFDVEVPEASATHECLMGERGIDNAVQLSGPPGGTVTMTNAPSGSTVTGGISVDLGNNESDVDLTKRVDMNADVVGKYRVMVTFVGRNPAAL